ncbi:MAG: chemotaxis protein CheW [Acidobacteria bacterium]|nr:chemotaxis protein CheW [Acidobacteriota bacterium]
MSRQDETSEAGLDLRQGLDDLATRLILSGGDRLPELAAALARIGRQAREAGYGEAARIAGELSASLDADPNGQPAQGWLQDGLARLQQTLADAGSGSAPEPPAAERPAAISSLAQDPELLADFILESREHLTSIEQRLLTLEREPADTDAIHSVFRGFHTIKGLAGFLEFPAIREVAHEVETALNLAREGQLAITPAVVDVVLESVDYLSRAIAAVEAGEGCDRMPGHDGLLGKVRALVAVEPGAPVETAPQAESDARRPAAAAESLSVRVDTGKLDYLMEMVGEMVIAQSLVRHSPALAAASDPKLQRDLAQLARITSEVQRTAMAMRMIPVGQLFQRVARQVRDLSRKVGKQVELVTRGEDTELDKTIAEALADPLMHMVRNAIDHGIESEDVRTAAGKAAQARITLSAHHRAGQIVIEVADDGRGLDTQKILAKARARGLVEDGARLPDADIFRLILEPGFSTADQVTDMSGRGVGLDVVRKQVEKLRGRIEIRSQAGRGTDFTLKLPLTLALIDGLVVAVGRHRYIVPLFAVREMFRPAAENLFTVRNRQEMALVRGRLLPVLRLYRRFNLAPRTEDPCQALLIVAEGDGQPFCLMVDDLIGKQEVVIKSLGEGLDKVPGVAGCAILGDGRVGLILDTGGLWGAHAGH